MSDNTEIRKLAAIMFTDMVGYSAIAQKNESLAIQMLEEHRGLLRPLFPKYGGREIETIGDAFFVEFGSAVEAVRCAIEMQHTLHERNQNFPADKHIRIRIGIHLGDVIQKGSHVLGDGVNIAARLEPLAPPEGICISEDVARQVQNKLDIPLHKLGQKNLKNIQFPMEIYSVSLPWQTADQPSTSVKTSTQLQSQSGKSETKKSNPLLWYSLAGVGVVGAIASYFIFNSHSTVPIEQNKPTVVRETVRVKDSSPQVSLPPPEPKASISKSKEKPVVEQPKTTTPENRSAEKKEETKPAEIAPPIVNADSILQLGLERYRSGDLREGKTLFTETLQHFRTARNKTGEADALLATARVLKYQDALAAAESKVEEALAVFKSLDNKSGVARCQVLLADVLIEGGKGKDAENVAGQIVAALPESDEAMVARALLAKAHAVLDNMEDALKQIQYFDGHQHRMEDMEWNAFIVATVVRVRAASRTLDRTQRQRQNFESEIQQSDNVPAQLEGRLAFGELAMKFGKAPQMGRRRLEMLNQDASTKGFALIARKARALLN